MVTKKIRTEYMKKFKDPKWETFSKCYEDSLKYRLTRRVMEHSHKPWIWEGWDNGSDSSGWSTPRLTRNRVAPLSLPLPASSEGRHKMELKAGPDPRTPPEQPDPGAGDTGAGDTGAGDTGAGDTAAGDTGAGDTGAGDTTLRTENGGGSVNVRGVSDGPADTASSDGEPDNPPPRRRHRRRTPRSVSGDRDGSHDDKAAVLRKLPRAKSQPPTRTKEEHRRPDRTGRLTAVRRTPDDSQTSDACVQTRRESDKRSSNLERRRARSADLEKMVRSRLMVVEDRWMTEYMRCFSARLR